ncbi:MAG: T9SS type A sorting domain-containing protein [Fibrobacter sp.]|nr:T9SS type A sorting domain-containing protein [Fibrobacter sp.]
MNKNIIFATFAFMGVALAQSVSPTFHWDGAVDVEGRVITGSTDSTSGWWFEYTDSNDQGTSKFVFPEDVEANAYNNFFGPLVEAYGGIKGQVMLQDGYEFPFAGLGFNVLNEDQKGADITAWGGLCVAYESTVAFGLELAVEGEKTVTKYDNYKANVSKAPAGAAQDYPWSKFKQGGWGKAVDQATALTMIATVKLKFEGAAGTTGDFVITELGSLCNCKTRSSTCPSDAIGPSTTASSFKATLSGRVLEFAGTTAFDKATIVDLQGKVVKSASAAGMMDLSALKAGMYMLRIEGQGINHSQKIVLK